MADVSSWTIQVWLSIGTFITATAAAIISYLNFQNFGKNKIAEFRTKWIDDLRKDMAELYSLHYEIGLLDRDIEKAKYLDDEKNAKKRRREAFIESSVLKRRILLRLKPNSDDPNEQKLEKLLRTSRNSPTGGGSIYRREMVDTTREILKSEWNRVKRELKIK